MIIKQVHEVTPIPGGALLGTDDALLELRFVAPNVLRVRLAPGGEFRAEETFVLESEPVPYVATTVSADEATVTLATAELRAEITRDPFALRLLDANGALVVATPADAPAIEWREGQRVQRLALPRGVGVYGLGQGALSQLDLRGVERRMWQEWNGYRHSGNDGIPLALTTAGYGVLLNSSWPSRWVIAEGEPGPAPVQPDWAPAPWPHGEPSGEGHPERLSVLLDGGELDLFIIHGPGLDRILESYVRLTGRPSLPPRWALGMIQCKNRYRSAEELAYVAEGYRSRGLPCDVLVIDWNWFEQFGDLAWIASDWPDPAALTTRLRELGFRVMQAQHPFIQRKARTYRTFKKRGFLTKASASAYYDAASFDHSNPQARAAWWATFRPIWRQGIRAYWTDMGELEMHPEGAKHALGPRERVHNVYSLLWSKGLYENQRRESDLRVCTLARTAWAGIPRYGTLMWSGDISATWEVLRDQVVVGQEVCLSGQPFWTTDIGGFHIDETFSGELYARWFEWGAFCPIFRTHGTRPGNEPWSFGPQVEAICTRYLKLRYRLLPYIYACARETHERGKPFMRAMVMDDAQSATAEHQFTFGPALLVAPVVEPWARSRQVTLPEGTWYDFWTGRPWEGGRTVEVEAPQDTLPLFVRGGSLIPMGPDVLFADERPLDEVTLHVYPGGEAAFALYEDDGDTYGYERGAYATTQLTYRENGVQQVTIDATEGTFKGRPSSRTWHLVFHDSAPPVSVRVDDATLDHSQWSYTLADHTLVVHLGEQSVQKAATITVLTGSLPGAALVRTPEMGVEAAPAADGARLWVRAYVRNPWLNPALTATFSLTPPPGWQATRMEQGREAAAGGATADAWWELSRDGSPTTCGPTAIVTAQVVLEDDTLTLQRDALLTHDYAASWLIAGPFPNRKKGFERVYPPEQGVDPQSVMQAGDGEVRWVALEADDCIGYINLATLLSEDNTKPIADGVAYTACAVWSPDERTAWAEISGEEQLKLWCNGESLLEIDSPRTIAPRRAEVTLRAGWNEVLIKATRSPQTEQFSGRMFGFYFRFVDKKGVPVGELRYAPQA